MPRRRLGSDISRRQPVSRPMVCVNRRRVEIHCFENSGCVGGHRVRHVRPFAVQDHRYLRGHELSHGRLCFPPARTVLLPKCGIRLIATSNIGCSLNQSAAEIDGALNSSWYEFRIWFQANTKQRVPCQGCRAKLIEVCQGQPLIIIVPSL
jgi:hypothetical protein